MKSITTFECDTCKRTIEKITNIHGLTVVGNCIITDNCKGKLVAQSVKRGYTTPIVPKRSITLKDYIPRKFIYNHEQTLPERIWTITHNLNNNPIIQLFVYDAEGNLIELTADITFVDVNTSRVTLTQEYAGIAQCIVRSTTSDQVIISSADTTETPEPIPFVTLSINKYINFASTLTTPSLKWYFVSPSTNVVKSFTTSTLLDISLNPTNVDTPWAGIEKVVIQGKRYNVYSVYIDISNFTQLDLGSVGYVYNSLGDVPFNKDECLFLLTNEPFGEVDKNLNQYAITTTMSPSSTESLLVVNETDFDINSSTLKTIYPSIKIQTS